MLILYLIRHGQTDCSRANRMCGAGIDSPLNDAGLAMAEALGEALAQQPWRAIYSSPLLRARQTAAPLAQRRGLAIEVVEGTQEIAYGAWDGRLEHEVEQSEPEAWANWQRDSGVFSPPGGENAHAVAARALPAIERIRSAHSDGPVVLFSHKAIIRAGDLRADGDREVGEFLQAGGLHHRRRNRIRVSPERAAAAQAERRVLPAARTARRSAAA